MVKTQGHGDRSAEESSLHTEEDAVIFNIQRFSVHDGPGIRTLVFFKGCPLRCQWCSNPESHIRKPQIAFSQNRCIGCLRCSEVCPHGAVRLTNRVRLEYDRLRCKECGACVATCYANARVLLGREMTVDEVMVEIRKDAVFYRLSSGGVTLGGGEPTMWPAFATKLLAACRSEGIHAAIETCGHAPWSHIEPLLDNLDLILFDMKHLDPEMHMRYTGVNNKLILENLNRIAQRSIPIVIRIPVIPGANNDAQTIRKIAAYVHDLGIASRIELLSYHRFGEEKYARLGRPYPLRDLKPPDEEEMETLAAAVRSEGLVCKIGG